MLIEHIAFNVPDPVSMADWYCRNLEMRLVRSFEAPNYGRFLADARGGTTLEFYRNLAVAVPDYAAQDARVMHIAFEVLDLDATCARLATAGASIEAPPGTSPEGDQLAMLRCPWGLPLQLVIRKR